MKIKTIKERIKEKNLNTDLKLIISNIIFLILTIITFNYIFYYSNQINNELSYKEYLNNPTESYNPNQDFKLNESFNETKEDYKLDRFNLDLEYKIIISIQLIIILNNLYYIFKKIEII